MPHKPIKAVIFDLDGVLADTAHAHHAAWARLAQELGFSLSDEIGERLKGVDRLTSLNIILDSAGLIFSDAEKAELAARKNGYYVDHIAQTTPKDLLPGAREALELCKAHGLKTALASASRNAPMLIENLGLAPLLDFIADAAKAVKSKPHPAIFLMAAEGIDIAPDYCLGVEDAVAGIEAIRAAQMHALGIGDKAILKDADRVISSIAEFDPAPWL